MYLLVNKEENESSTFAGKPSQQQIIIFHFQNQNHGIFNGDIDPLVYISQAFCLSDNGSQLLLAQQRVLVLYPIVGIGMIDNSSIQILSREIESKNKKCACKMTSNSSSVGKSESEGLGPLQVDPT